MAIEFLFRITKDEIHVCDKQTGFDRTFVNRVAVYDKGELIVAMGEPDEEVRSRLGVWYVERASDVRFLTLFGADGADLPYEIRMLEHLTRMLHGQSLESRQMKHLVVKVVNGFDYVLEIPGYEAFPEARRHALEESLQAHLRMRRLVINGRDVQIPVHRREAEFWLRRLLVWAFPVAATAVGYATASPAMLENRLAFFVYLLAIAFIAYYGGRVLWMLCARPLVPATYRLCMLQGPRRRLTRFDRVLAHVLW